MAAEIRGIPKLLKRIDKIRALNVIPVITDGVRTIQNTAKDIVPVDTSNLRNSITTRVDSSLLRGYVSTNVEYAPYVEYGTSRMKAQPFLFPAYYTHKRNIVKSIRQALKDSLK
jgi:HK97 gp10 family phage protein